MLWFLFIHEKTYKLLAGCHILETTAYAAKLMSGIQFIRLIERARRENVM